MHKCVLKHLLMLIPVILGVSFLAFFIMSLAPGDTARTILGDNAPMEATETLNEELGLDNPVLVCYVRYMENLVQGDLGTSYKSGRPVFSEVMSRFPDMLELAFWGMVFAIVLSIPIDIISATRQYSFMDSADMVLALLGVTTPNFWLGLMLIIGFSLHLRWFPSSDSEGWRALVLPVITLGIDCMANTTRATRSSVLEVIHQDYIRTAKAKGINDKGVICKHALENVPIPVVTVIDLQFGSLLGGTVLTEAVFSWPGIGTYLVNNTKVQDTNTVLGCVIIFFICFSIVNLTVDILYTYIDPRVKSKYK